MKIFFDATVFLLLAGELFAGDIGAMMKEKARSFGGNNAQQGSPPPNPSGQPPAPAAPSAPAPQPLTPSQQALARLVTDLSKPTADQLGGDLTFAAQGPNKPTPTTVHKLAKDLAAALAGRAITPVQRSRVAQDLQAVVSGSNVPAAQMEDIIGDVPAILKRAGADAAAATAVGDDLKAVNAELKKKPAK